MSPSMPERWRVHDLLLQRDALWQGERRWPGFEAWCAEHPRRRCRLWVSAALLHELVCDPALPLRDDAAALAWARPLLQHYHGEAAAGWPLAAWRQGRQRGVSALHGLGLQPLQACAASAHVRLLGISPWWSLQLQQALARHRALRAAQARLVVEEGGLLALLDLRRGRLVGLTLRQPDPRQWQGLAPAAGDTACPTLALQHRAADRWLDGRSA